MYLLNITEYCVAYVAQIHTVCILCNEYYICYIQGCIDIHNVGMCMVRDGLKERAFIPWVCAPAWPGQYKRTGDGPSILIQPLQCCFPPNFYMFFLSFSSCGWVPTTRVVSRAIPSSRDPHLDVQNVPGLKFPWSLPISW